MRTTPVATPGHKQVQIAESARQAGGPNMRVPARRSSSSGAVSAALQPRSGAPRSPLGSAGRTPRAQFPAVRCRARRQRRCPPTPAGESGGGSPCLATAKLIPLWLSPGRWTLERCTVSGRAQGSRGGSSRPSTPGRFRACRWAPTARRRALPQRAVCWPVRSGDREGARVEWPWRAGDSH